MGIVDGVLTAALEAAAEAGAIRIVSVQVEIGALMGVVEDALQFAWEALTSDTIAEGATLEVRSIEAASRCGECGHVYPHGRFDGARCPACGSPFVTLASGRELSIASIEIED